MAFLCISLSSREIIVAFLSVLFGIGSQIIVSGLWIELPVLSQSLPEGSNLTSYLVIIMLFGNIGLLLYSFIKRFWPSVYIDYVAVNVMMAFGFFSCLLLVFLWTKTSVLWGHEHSTSFLSLSFFASLVDSSSSIVFLPFMAHLKEKYLNAYLIGESMTGLLTHAVAVGQNISRMECNNGSFINITFQENFTDYDFKLHIPLFSVENFFIFLTVFMGLSWTAFILLSFLPQARKEQICPFYHNSITSEVFIINSVESIQCCGVSSFDPLISNEGQPCLYYADQVPNSSLEDTGYMPKKKSLRKCSCMITTKKYIYMLSLQAYLCVLSNGIFPIIQPYSSLPYGRLVYHLSLILCGMIKPAVCFTAVFIVVRSCKTVSLLSFLVTAICIYPLATALICPSLPLHVKPAGQAIMMISWIVMDGLFWFLKATIANILRREGKHALFWYGVVTQTGSTLGMLMIYLVLNFGSIFSENRYCISS